MLMHDDQNELFEVLVAWAMNVVFLGQQLRAGRPSGLW